MSFEPIVQWINADEAQERKRTRWSNFWIMINSNQAGQNVVERSHLVKTMRRVIDEVFGVKATMVKYIRVIDDSGEDITGREGRKDEIAKIESVTSEAVVEVGPTVHRVHAHILLMIQHKTRVQLDVGVLRDLLREKSEEDGRYLFPNPIVRLKYIKENPLNAIRNYQRGYKGRLPASLIEKVSRRAVK